MQGRTVASYIMHDLKNNWFGVVQYVKGFFFTEANSILMNTKITILN